MYENYFKYSIDANMFQLHWSATFSSRTSRILNVNHFGTLMELKIAKDSLNWRQQSKHDPSAAWHTQALYSVWLRLAVVPLSLCTMRSWLQWLRPLVAPVSSAAPGQETALLRLILYLIIFKAAGICFALMQAPVVQQIHRGGSFTSNRGRICPSQILEVGPLKRCEVCDVHHRQILTERKIISLKIRNFLY